MKFILGLMLVSLLGACAAQTLPSTVQLTAGFDEAAARAMMVKGNNTITGSATIRQDDGGVATCAGNVVELIPATDYANERMSRIYASTVRGASSTGVFTFEPDPPEYQIVRRATTCDANGAFTFQGIADGTFYLITGVWWKVDDAQEGANLMLRVTLRDGDKQTVALTPDTICRHSDLWSAIDPRPVFSNAAPRSSCRPGQP